MQSRYYFLISEERKLPPTLRTERWYRHHTQLLTPFLLSTHTKMFSYTEIEYKKMIELTRWMKQAYTLETCFNLWASYKKTLSQLNLHECVLLVRVSRQASEERLILAPNRCSVSVSGPSLAPPPSASSQVGVNVHTRSKHIPWSLPRSVLIMGAQ